MLTNGCNIGVFSKLLGHAIVQVTLDVYGDYNDQLMRSQAGMIRENLVSKEEKNVSFESKDNSTTKRLIHEFKHRDKNN